MRTSKLFSLIPALAAIVPALGLTACSSADTTPTTAAPTNAKLDGKTIYQGVFFGQGEVAKSLPEIWGNSAAESQTLKNQIKESPEEAAAKIDKAADSMKAAGWSDAMIARTRQTADAIRKGLVDPQATQDSQGSRDLVMARIVEKDPTFFTRYGTAMQSGDPVKVEQTMAEGAKLLQTVVDELQTLDQGGFQTADNYVYYVGYVYVAGAAFTVAVVLSVVAAVLVWILEPMDAEGHSRLGRAELVARLTHDLALPR